jgi:hypothetical protein
MFKAAAKLFAGRDDEAQAATRKRKGGEKEGGAPMIRLRTAITLPIRIAARGRYAGLRFVQKSSARLLRKFAAAADDAGLPELTETQELPANNTLEWLNLWVCQDNASFGHGLDDHYDTQQNRNSPHL